MAKYRKLPVVIDAVQWFPSSEGGPVIDSVREVDPTSPDDYAYGFYVEYAEIDTLEGTMRVDRGDWIITGVKGEKYPCKDSIFKMTYEAVSE